MGEGSLAKYPKGPISKRIHSRDDFRIAKNNGQSACALAMIGPSKWIVRP
jgi:hypothetical protein